MRRMKPCGIAFWCARATAGVALVVLAGASVLAQNARRLDEIVQSYASSGRFMGAVLVARSAT